MAASTSNLIDKQNETEKRGAKEKKRLKGEPGVVRKSEKEWENLYNVHLVKWIQDNIDNMHYPLDFSLECLWDGIQG